MSQKWVDIKGRYIRDPRFGHRLGKSYLGSKKIKKAGYQEGIVEQSTDQYGFVDNGYHRELPDEFNKDHIGVVMLGGSCAMGLGATDNSKTISAVLEKKLGQGTSSKISVINAGCGGYNSWDEMIYFLTEIILKKPQIVVSFTGLNDFVAEYFGSKYYDERIPNTSRSLEDIAEAIKFKNYKLSFLELLSHKFKQKKFYKKILNIYRGAKGDVKLNEQNFVWGLENIKKKYDPKVVSLFWKNQISILGACKAHNIKCHLYIQPCYFWNKKKTLTSEEKNGINFDRKLFKEHYEDTCKKYYNDFLNETKNYLNNYDQKDNFFESLVDIFDNLDEQCYIDNCHLSNTGQEIVANKISQNILASKYPFIK